MGYFFRYFQGAVLDLNKITCSRGGVFIIGEIALGMCASLFLARRLRSFFGNVMAVNPIELLRENQQGADSERKLLSSQWSCCFEEFIHRLVKT